MKVLSSEKLDRMASFIKGYMHDNNGAPPKFSEILSYMGMTNSVGYRYLTRLKERGDIEYNGKGTLGMSGEYTRQSRSRKVPILGNVICGSPEEEEQHALGYLAIPEEWLTGDCFLLCAYGDSMVDAGIDEGDLVLVRRAESAAAGQIVVALTESGNTLKRLSYENGVPVLLAENSSYSEEERIIRPASLSLQGIAVKLIKDFK